MLQSTKYITLFLAFCCLLSLSSCFEIREELDINKDGSGKYSLLIDMSESKRLIDMAMALNQDQKNGSPLSEMDSSFNKGIARFESMEGISNPVAINDQERFIFGMQFNFANMAALNNALNDAYNERYPEMKKMPEVFKFAKKTIERTNFYQLRDLNEMNPMSEDTENAADARMLMGSATYSCIIRTPGKVKSYSNSAAILSETAREVTFKVPLLDVVESKVDISNVIKFK
jgi:hypothetical protein